MFLKKLYLQSFRNYKSIEVSFSSGVNWIVGKNAQGKTNLLEAIFLLSTGRSFRTSQLKELIHKGSSFFYIEAEIEKEGVSQTLKVSLNGEEKRVEWDNTVYRHFTPLMGMLPHVLFAPEDEALISGPPALRRKLLNLHIAQMDPLYIYHLGRYHRAMEQRNELLRRKNIKEIDPWEIAMAQSASYVMQEREKTLLEIKLLLETSLREDDIAVDYQSSLPLSQSQDTLIHYWQKSRLKDLHLSVTSQGPHRDDLKFTINGISAKAFASEGQKRSFLATLHLARWNHLKKQTLFNPLMSIDDFGAHLDKERQSLLEEKITSLGQVFLTAVEIPSQMSSHNPIILANEPLAI